LKFVVTTTESMSPGSNVVLADGKKLTIAFDKAGEKRVVDSFVERV
jgi:hypothetical protein